MTVLSRVERQIWTAGLNGCTDIEGETESGIGGDSWRPARVALARAGRIVKNGEKRETPLGHRAWVWVHRANIPLNMGGMDMTEANNYRMAVFSECLARTSFAPMVEILNKNAAQ